MSTKPISEFLPYKFLWPSDKEWLEDMMRYERYDLLKPKTSRDLTDEETTIINKQLESSSVELVLNYSNGRRYYQCQ